MNVGLAKDSASQGLRYRNQSGIHYCHAMAAQREAHPLRGHVDLPSVLVRQGTAGREAASHVAEAKREAEEQQEIGRGVTTSLSIATRKRDQPEALRGHMFLNQRLSMSD